MKYFLASVFAMALVGGMMATSSEAATLFEDNFDSGINDTVWYRENNNGSQWQWSSPEQNISSQPTGYENWYHNRYLDISTKKNNFTNFTLTFDMRFNNDGNDQDNRSIYLRAQSGDGVNNGDALGYWISIQNWSPGSDRFHDGMSISSYNEDKSSTDYTWTYTPFDVNVWYRFKAEVDGNQINVKYWDRDNAEPSDWLLTATDPNNRFSSGQIGFGNYWFASTNIDNVLVTGPTVTPEPIGSALFLLGGGVLAFKRYRRKKMISDGGVR